MYSCQKWKLRSGVWCVRFVAERALGDNNNRSGLLSKWSYPPPIFSAWIVWRIGRLTRDGTAEPISRDQILRRRERGQGNINFPCSADHDQDWQPFRLLIHTCIRDYCINNNGEWGKRKSRIRILRQHPLLELPWGLLALCRRTLGSERHRYIIASGLTRWRMAL